MLDDLDRPTGQLCSHGNAGQVMIHVQPKEMPFCLARLMTICVLDAGGTMEMQDEDGVSRRRRTYRQHLCKREARVHKHHITNGDSLERSIV
jgi:hypothetical protein